MSVQVCFNLTEDFMIERCKLIGFLTGCWDRIATLSKRDRVSDRDGTRIHGNAEVLRNTGWQKRMGEE